MSTTLNIPAPRTKATSRTKILAACTGLVAAASISITLAAGLGGSESSSAPLGSSATAAPDRATLYMHSPASPGSGGAVAGQRSAERFHHFR